MCSRHDPVTLQDAFEIAADYGFRVEALQAHIAEGRITEREMIDRLMAEIYGDGGLAGY